VIRAPFAGIAVSKDAQPGEMVSPVSAGGGFTRTGISTIVDMESLEIEVDVNESYIARVSPGQPADAVLDAYPEWRIPATVRTIIPTADRQKATVKVRLTFDRLDPKILPDMGIKVAFLELAEHERGARPQAQSLIPASAVRREGSQPVVFIVDGDVVERRAVTLGRELGTEVEVIAGVAPGERLAVQNLDALPDGVREGEEIRDPVGKQQREPRASRQERTARHSRSSSLRISLASAVSSWSHPSRCRIP